MTDEVEPFLLKVTDELGVDLVAVGEAGDARCADRLTNPQSSPGFPSFNNEMMQTDKTNLISVSVSLIYMLHISVEFS